MKTFSIRLIENVPVTCPSDNGNLKLAASNFVFGKYKDEKGRECTGWSAAMSMMTGEKRETYKAFKVFPGKSAGFEKSTVNVQRIESSRFGMIVLAEISLPE